MLSMSFTLNIVNIHRTILHVLALRLRRGRNLVYFTRTPQKREKRGEEKEGGGGVKRHAGLVWSKAQLQWPFSQESHKLRGIQVRFLYGPGGKISKPSSVMDAGGGACCPPNVNQRQKKKVCIICIKKFLSAVVTEASRSQQGLVGCVRSPEGPSSHRDSEEEQKESLLLSLQSQFSSVFQSLPGVGDGGLLSEGPRDGEDKRRSTVGADERVAKEEWDGRVCSLQVDTPQVSR